MKSGEKIWADVIVKGLIVLSLLFSLTACEDMTHSTDSISAFDTTQESGATSNTESEMLAISKYFTSVYQLPESKIAVDVPEGEREEQGDTTVIKIAANQYICITSCEQEQAETPKEAYDILFPCLQEDTAAWTQIRSIAVALSNVYLVGDKEIYLYEGVLERQTEPNYYITGYTTLIDCVPVMIVGIVTGDEQIASEINNVKTVTKEMTETLR